MDTLAIIKRIEMRLSEIGMSKADFYDKSGISSASFSQWRTGTYRPSPKKLENAATVLNVSYDYLLNGLYRSDVSSFANGVTIFRGASQQELDLRVSALVAGTYRIVFRGPGIVITVDNNSSATDAQINEIIKTYVNLEQNKKEPADSGERDILDDVDVAFYGDFKELSEDEKETVRDMVRLMRQRKEKRSQ